MKSVNIEIGVKGRYKVLKKRDGKVTFDSGWFKNLITNQGMDFLSNGSLYLGACQVGSSSATPAFTDVALGSRIAGSNTASSSFSVNTTERYAIQQRTFTFFAGTATGNISEVGVGTSTTGSTLFSRALVLDSGGSPTTVTVLADEDLVIVYQLWMKQPTGDYPVTVSGQTITVRAALVNSASAARGWAAGQTAGEQLAAPTNNNTHAVHSGAIGAITGEPAGTPAYASATSITSEAYVPGSWTRVSNLRWLASEANGTWLSASWRFGPTFWQASFSPGITKTSVQSLRIKVRLTWSRDSGPA